jgi:hypothetical protein
MTRLTRRFVRSALFAIVAMGLSGCYYCGHHGGWGYHGHYHARFCAPVCVPIPRCR